MNWIPRILRATVRHRRLLLLATLLWLWGLDGFGGPRAAAAEVLRGAKVAVEAVLKDGRLHERYLASREGTWVEVATADLGQTAGPVGVVTAEGPLLGSARGLSVSDGTMVEEFALGEHRVTRQLTLLGEGPWIRVVTRFAPAGRVSLRQFSDHFQFSQRPDWSYSPSVGGFNPDAQYKAPLILVQAAQTALGLVPDVTTLNRDVLLRCSHALDLDVPGGPSLAVGFSPAKLASHSVYALGTNRTWTADAPLENSYYLLVTASAPPAQAYREAVRFHWEHFGRAAQAQAAAQQVGTDPRYKSLALWDDWREMVWKQESPEKWLPVPLPDGSTGGGVRTKRWGPGPSVYLSSWFNTLRTSYGMALYAKRTANTNLLSLARQTVEVALKAPGRDGAFKCIAVPQPGGTVWAAGDGSGGSTKDGFLGYDMCWTAYWLLKWRAAELPGCQGILPRCRELARFMIARQTADGLLPTRFAEEGSAQEETSRTVKAETGPVVLFLLELYRQDRNVQYLEAAKKGLAFLEKEVIPLRQWYDYETFWSCSPRTARFDERTQQWPANNLALVQTVQAYLLAHQITGEGRYLATGEALLDYLLLYQQCWTNPRLENLTGPAMLLGGFTTQNSDAEWSDARQSQCGNLLMDYYRATGKIEYLERGIAALRSQFPVSPSENWAHVGYGGKAGVSSFHWGTGSGMAGIEIEEAYLRDAVVDLTARRGIGVNGLNVTQCQVGDGQIRLRLSSPFAWKRSPVVVFRPTEPARRYQVFVNGTEAGAWQGRELEQGVPLDLRPQPMTHQTAARRLEIQVLERKDLPGGLVRERWRLPGFDPDEAVPAIAVHPAVGGPFPVALCLHCFRGAKESLEPWCRDLAARGIFAITLDAYLHGERSVNGIFHGDNIASLGAEYSIWVHQSSIARTAKDVPIILDALARRPDVDATRIAVTGFSMGASTAMVLAWREPRVRVVAGLVGAVDFWWDVTKLPPGPEQEKRKASYGPRLRELVNSIDPQTHLAQVPPKSLCLINGGRDEYITLDSIQRFVTALEPLYGQDRSRLRFVPFPEATHGVTAPMWKEAQDWIVRYLGEESTENPAK